VNTKRKQFQIFDPNPSLRFALKLFLKAGVTQSDIIEKQASAQGLNYNYLHIGGIGIREKGINIDFIDRRLHKIDRLFGEAIENAYGEVFVDENKNPVVSLDYLIAMKMVSGEPRVHSQNGR